LETDLIFVSSFSVSARLAALAKDAPMSKRVIENSRMGGLPPMNDGGRGEGKVYGTG
jgi:hypothetical protein